MFKREPFCVSTRHFVSLTHGVMFPNNFSTPLYNYFLRVTNNSVEYQIYSFNQTWCTFCNFVNCRKNQCWRLKSIFVIKQKFKCWEIETVSLVQIEIALHAYFSKDNNLLSENELNHNYSTIVNNEALMNF